MADSQAALDQGVIDTVNTLGNTNITVVTDVIQHLNDDGEPDPALTELVTTDLSVLNFFTPTIHEWKRVALSMDLSVGAFSESDGLTFNAEQSGGGVGGVGLFWGFLGLAYDNDYDNSQSVPALARAGVELVGGRGAARRRARAADHGQVPDPRPGVGGPADLLRPGHNGGDTGGRRRGEPLGGSW